MFNQTINPPEVFLNEDFIGVWDNVTLDDFNNLVIKTLDESVQVVPRSNTSVKDAQLDIAAFNAAKEEALDNFLDHKLSFLGMADVVKATIDELTSKNLLSSDVEIDAVMKIDSHARTVAKMFVDKF